MFDTILHRLLRAPYALYVRSDHRPKKPRATILFIHGIGNNGSAWDEVIHKLPLDVRTITIDLLGFGQSPKPTWAIYNARTQANSVIATFLKLRVTGQVIIVGHSLGALVAVEFAKRYPLLVKSLVLCSPPFYKQDSLTKSLLPSNDRVLKDIFTAMQRRPEQFVRMSALAMRYKLVNKSFSVNDENIHSYIGALQASIVNQTAFDDAKKLKMNTRILHGSLDPVVVYSNLKSLAAANPHITVSNVLASHEIKGMYTKRVVNTIVDLIDKE